MVELLNTRQTAQKLGMSAGTLMVWRCTKRYPLPYIRVGRNIRYRMSDIENFLATRTMSGVSEAPSGRRKKVA